VEVEVEATNRAVDTSKEEEEAIVVVTVAAVDTSKEEEEATTLAARATGVRAVAATKAAAMEVAAVGPLCVPNRSFLTNRHTRRLSAAATQRRRLRRPGPTGRRMVDCLFSVDRLHARLDEVFTRAFAAGKMAGSSNGFRLKIRALHNMSLGKLLHHGL
jgi:hypothetical protein